MRWQVAVRKHRSDMILIKQHNATGVAHLYEHLFTLAINDLFFRHKLSPYVDYSIHAQPLTAGIIYVDVRFYTEKAQALAEEIKRLTIQRDTPSITKAITQVVAELEKAFKVTKDIEEISEELGEVEAQPWQEINDLDEIDPERATITAGSFYVLKNAEEMPSLSLNTSFTLDQHFAEAHRELLPLFWQLARLMDASIKTNFHSLGAIYSKDVSHVSTNELIQLTHHYSLHRDISLQASRVLDQASRALRDLSQTNGIVRFVNNLKKVTESDLYRVMPDPVAMLHQSGILIGAKGWDRIATNENLDLILSHTELSVNVDNEHASIAVNVALDVDRE